MKRTVLFLMFLAAGGLALWTQTASVRASGSTTILPPMYHTQEEEGAMFVVIHNGATPVISGKDRFAIGDKLVFGGPLYGTKDLNLKGGKSVATFYGEATVVKGDAFDNMLTMMHFDFIFPNGDHISGHGIVDWVGTEQSVAITGGTGAYEGARGTMRSRLDRSSNPAYGVDNLIIKSTTSSSN